MSEIVVNDEQAKIIVGSTDQVFIRDRHGNLLATIPPRISARDAEVLNEAKRRLAAGQRRYTTSQALERLKSLERQ